MAATPSAVCCATTRGAAAITVAAAPVFSILRLIGSIIGVLPDVPAARGFAMNRARPNHNSAGSSPHRRITLLSTTEMRR
jgi:hypothetical protein